MKTIIKKLTAVTLALSLAMGFGVSTSQAKSSTPKLEKTKLSLTYWDVATVKIQSVKKSQVKKLTATTNNKKIATVETDKKNLTVKVYAGEKEGKAEISVKIKTNKKTYNKKINVKVTGTKRELINILEENQFAGWADFYDTSSISERAVKISVDPYKVDGDADEELSHQIYYNAVSGKMIIKINDTRIVGGFDKSGIKDRTYVASAKLNAVDENTWTFGDSEMYYYSNYYNDARSIKKVVTGPNPEEGVLDDDYFYDPAYGDVVHFMTTLMDSEKGLGIYWSPSLVEKTDADKVIKTEDGNVAVYDFPSTDGKTITVEVYEEEGDLFNGLLKRVIIDNPKKEHTVWAEFNYGTRKRGSKDAYLPLDPEYVLEEDKEVKAKVDATDKKLSLNYELFKGYSDDSERVTGKYEVTTGADVDFVLYSNEGNYYYKKNGEDVELSDPDPLFLNPKPMQAVLSGLTWKDDYAHTS